MTGYQKLGLVTIIGLLALTTLGGTVRVTDSGLACPDWPLCHGKIIPSGDYHVWLEWTHRLVASLMGFVILAYVGLAVLRYRDRGWIVVPAVASIVFLGVQVILGGLTVTEDLDAAIVSAHLAVAMVIVLLITTSWLATFARVAETDEAPADPARRDGRRLAMLAIASAVGIYTLIVVGAYVTNADAGFFCGSDWPLCNGSVIPDGEKAQIQMGHRFLAALVGALLLVTWRAARRQRDASRTAFRLATAMLHLYAIQVVLGAATMWSDLADWSRVVHLAGGTALWGVTVALAVVCVYEAGWAQVRRTPGGLQSLFRPSVSAGEKPLR